MADIFNFYVYDDRTIQFELAEPIMLEDSNVTQFQFRIPKVLNELDMHTWAWWFVYENASAEKYSVPLILADDADDPDNYSLAVYTVDAGMSGKAGSIRFALEVIDADATTSEILHEWHTRTYTTHVVSTLQGNEREFTPSEYDLISAKLEEIMELIEGGVGGGTSDDIENKSTVSGATVTNALTSLSDQIANEATARQSAVSSEASTRASADESLRSAIDALVSPQGQSVVVDSSLSISGAAADAKVTGDAVSDLKSDLDTGYHRVDAVWARGKIENGQYTDSDYRRVATVSAIPLKFGDIFSIAEGYRYQLTLKTAESYFTTDWINQDLSISRPGEYLICIASDPDSSEYITDIEHFISKLTHSDNSQRKISVIDSFIRRYVMSGLEPGKNLFNRDAVEDGRLLDRNTGVVVPSANNVVSDFIKVKAEETIYKRNCSNWYACLFDNNYNYVGLLPNSNDVSITQDGYIRVTVAKTNIETAVISRIYPLPDASDYHPSFIDRSVRKEVEEMSTWSNTVETLVSQMEIRDANYHAAGSIDISKYAFVSLRISNDLSVPCTMNFYDDRNSTSSMWMSRPDGSFVSVNIPAGVSIITADDFKELPYMKLLRPIITPASAPESGTITIQIVGRK